MIELESFDVRADITEGAGESGTFFLADSARVMPRLLDEYAGQIQMIYLDPPCATGKRFDMRMRVGEKDWRTSSASFTQPAFFDGHHDDDYTCMMREILTGAKYLLNDTGTIFLHTNTHIHAYLKVIMDEVFGQRNMLNEIVWTYQTGGRAKNYFARKHDTILFYRKTPRYYFSMKSIETVDPESRVNHMKRGVDSDGRQFRSIRSGGKTYFYFDDDPIYPSDVWSDMSYMNKRDPQRTGYDTQKPTELIRRMIKCTTKPGDIVCDLFAGSGSSFDAAHSLSRRFLGVDNSLMSMYTVRKRMSSCPVEYRFDPCPARPAIEISCRAAVGYYVLTLEGYALEQGLTARQFNSLDAVDSWAVGYVKGGVFRQEAGYTRSKATPEIKKELWLPVYEGIPTIRIGDVFGRYLYYKFNKDGIQ